jgi:integrase
VRGSIWQLPDGRWRIRWRTQEGRRPSETFRLKETAERALRKHVDEVERGVVAVNRRQTLADFLPEWERSTEPAVKPRTWDAYEQHVRTWIKPRLGSQPLVSINQRGCQRFVDELVAHGLAPKTVRGIYGTLCGVIGLAAEYGFTQRVPGVRLPRIVRTEILIPTPPVIEAIAGEIDPRLWALVRLCAYAGLRQGEGLALRPQDVDWLGRRIRVEATLNKRNRRREETKGNRGRWVTMPTVVADSLSAHIAEYPCSDWIFHRRGRPWPATKAWAAWDAARKTAAPDLPDLDFHHLRHHAVSLMISAGWSVKRVQVEAGHSDPAFTLRVYGHLFPDELETGRIAMDRLLAARLGPPADHNTAVESPNPPG